MIISLTMLKTKTTANFKNWYLYVLLCGDNSFYVGVTVDVARRVRQHAAGVGARYTRSHLPVTLLCSMLAGISRSEAQRLERVVKKLRRKQKEKLVEALQKGDLQSVEILLSQTAKKTKNA